MAANITAYSAMFHPPLLDTPLSAGMPDGLEAESPRETESSKRKGHGSTGVPALPSRSNLQAGPLQLPRLRRLAPSPSDSRCFKAMRM